MDDYNSVQQSLRRVVVPFIQKVLRDKPTDYIEYCAEYFQNLYNETKKDAKLSDEEVDGSKEQDETEIEDLMDIKKPPLQGSASLPTLTGEHSKGLCLRETSSWNRPNESQDKSHRKNIIYNRADFARQMGDQPDVIQEYEEVILINKNEAVLAKKLEMSDENERLIPETMPAVDIVDGNVPFESLEGNSNDTEPIPTAPPLREEIDSYLCELVDRASSFCFPSEPESSDSNKRWATEDEFKTKFEATEASSSSNSSDSDDSCDSSYYPLCNEDEQQEVEKNIGQKTSLNSCRFRPDLNTMERGNLAQQQDSSETNMASFQRLNFNKIDNIVKSFSHTFHNLIHQLRATELYFKKRLQVEIGNSIQNQTARSEQRYLPSQSLSMRYDRQDINCTQNAGNKSLFIHRDVSQSVSEDSGGKNAIETDMEVRKNDEEIMCNSCPEGKTEAYCDGSNKSGIIPEHNNFNVTRRDHVQVENVGPARAKKNSPSRGRKYWWCSKKLILNPNLGTGIQRNTNEGVIQTNKDGKSFENKTEVKTDNERNKNDAVTNNQKDEATNCSHIQSEFRQCVTKYQHRFESGLQQSINPFRRETSVPFQYIRPLVNSPASYPEVARIRPTSTVSQIGEQGDVLPHPLRQCSVGTETYELRQSPSPPIPVDLEKDTEVGIIGLKSETPGLLSRSSVEMVEDEKESDSNVRKGSSTSLDKMTEATKPSNSGHGSGEIKRVRFDLSRKDFKNCKKIENGNDVNCNFDLQLDSEEDAGNCSEVLGSDSVRLNEGSNLEIRDYERHGSLKIENEELKSRRDDARVKSQDFSKKFLTNGDLGRDIRSELLEPEQLEFLDIDNIVNQRNNCQQTGSKEILNNDSNSNVVVKTDHSDPPLNSSEFSGIERPGNERSSEASSRDEEIGLQRKEKDTKSSSETKKVDLKEEITLALIAKQNLEPGLTSAGGDFVSNPATLQNEGDNVSQTSLTESSTNMISIAFVENAVREALEAKDDVEFDYFDDADSSCSSELSDENISEGNSDSLNIP